MELGDMIVLHDYGKNYLIGFVSRFTPKFYVLNVWYRTSGVSKPGFWWERRVSHHTEGRVWWRVPGARRRRYAAEN